MGKVSYVIERIREKVNAFSNNLYIFAILSILNLIDGTVGLVSKCLLLWLIRVQVVLSLLWQTKRMDTFLTWRTELSGLGWKKDKIDKVKYELLSYAEPSPGSGRVFSWIMEKYCNICKREALHSVSRAFDSSSFTVSFPSNFCSSSCGYTNYVWNEGESSSSVVVVVVAILWLLYSLVYPTTNI